MEFQPFPDSVWQPPAERIDNAQITQLIAACGAGSYDELLQRADADPAWFWNEVIKFLDVRFYEPCSEILDASGGIEWTSYCLNGKTNMVLNCLDKHRGTATWHKQLLIHEAEDGSVSSLTYAEVDTEVSRLAEGLRALGLGQGDAIGLYMPMIPEVVIAYLAIVKIGAMVIPLFSGFGPEPITIRLNDGNARAVIIANASSRRGTAIDMKQPIDAARDDIPSLEHVIVHRHLDVEVAWRDGDCWWRDLTADRTGDSETQVMDADAPMMLVYTSGTTGMPKGTVLTHCGFTVKGMADLQIMFDLTSEDRMLWMSDMGWVVGPLEILAATFTGASLVIAEGAFNFPEPGRIWRLVQDHKVSWLGLAPTIARSYMREPPAVVSQYDLSSLHTVVSTGEPWTTDAWLWLFDNVCGRRVPILNYTGGTEIGGGILGCTVIRPLKPCCFNTAMPGMGADVVDERGRTMATGQVGELALRNHSIGLTRGLWQNPERYLDSYWRTIEGLWIHGDWAARDDDGMWYVLGRSDDTLKIAGKRTGPAEIEGPLMATGKIVEAAVIGVPDPVGGAAVACVCVPVPGVDEASLKAELSAAVVAAMGKAFRPKHVILVDDLPKTRTLKVMRRVVKALLLGSDPGDLSSLMNPESIAALKLKRIAETP